MKIVRRAEPQGVMMPRLGPTLGQKGRDPGRTAGAMLALLAFAILAWELGRYQVTVIYSGETPATAVYVIHGGEKRGFGEVAPGQRLRASFPRGEGGELVLLWTAEGRPMSFDGGRVKAQVGGSSAFVIEADGTVTPWDCGLWCRIMEGGPR